MSARKGSISWIRIAGLLIIVVTAFTAIHTTSWPAQVDEGARAQALFHEGKYKEAVDACNRLLVKSPKDTNVLSTRGAAKLALGDNKGALSDFDSCLASGYITESVCLGHGRANRALGNVEGSIGDFTRAIRLDPTSASPYFQRANSYHRLQREEQALKDADTYLKLNGKDAWGFDFRGLVYMSLGNYLAAEPDFEHAVMLGGKEGRFYADRSFARRRLKKFQEALADAEAAIKLGYTEAPAYNTRGLARTDVKDYAAALRDFDLAIAKDPKIATYVANKGLCFSAMGNLDAADRELAKALSIDPKNAIAYRYRAELNEKRGDMDKARAEAQEAFRLDPLNPTIKELAARLLPTVGVVKSGDVLETPAKHDVRSDSGEGKLTGMKSVPPWTPASGPIPNIPRTAPAAPIAPLLDISDITVATYNGAVSAAMEAMRLIYGDMTPEQDADFRKRWNPLFDNPTPEGLEYLNKLNPLLGQFLAIRASIAEASAAFDSARLETITAAGLGDEAGTREALEVGFQHKNELESLRTSLADVVAKIVALGNPPNPIEGRRARRKAHREAVEFLRDQAPAKSASASKGTGLYWVLKSLDTGGARNKDTGDQTSSTRYTFQSTEGMAAASFHEASKEFQCHIAGSITWTPPARVMKDLEVPDTISAKYTQFDFTPTGGTPLPNLEKALETMSTIGYWVGSTPNNVDTVYWNYNATRTEPISRTGSARSLSLFGGVHNTQGKATTSFAITIKTVGGTAWYRYTYEEKELTADQVQAILDAEAKSKASLAKQQADLAGRQHAEQEEAALKTAAVANVQANIAYFQDRAADLRNKLATSPPASRESLNRMRMVAEANLQGEKDQLTSIQTGEYVHTRTEFDDYCLSRMLENDRAQTEKLESEQRKIVNYPRLIALLPEDMQYEERKQTSERLNKAIEAGDYAQVDQIVKNLSDRVQAYWQVQAAKQTEKAAWADLGLEIAQNVKDTADSSLFLMSFFGGSGVYAAYQGATGYLSGGVVEAVKQAAGAYSVVAYMAVEAYDGYQKGGLSGAVFNVATQGAIFYAMHKIAAPLAASFQAGGAARKWPTIEQTIKEAQFQAQYAEGRSLVKVFQQRQARLAEAGRSGAAKDLILKLRGEAEQAAMAIKNSYTAKMVLNQAAREGDAALMHAYISQERQFMGRLKDSFESRMTADGWSQQAYKEFRNSASVGKAGIDLDLGAVEPKRWITGPGGEQVPNPEYLNWRQNLTQDGKPRTLREFQEAGQKNLDAAYKDVFGRGPSEAFLNFTTSGHPEAYKDLAWLGRKPFKVADVPNIDAGWARQAADVTGFKVMHSNRSTSWQDYYLGLQEQCRGIVKDFDTKLEPLMKLAKPEIKSHWAEIRTVMADFSTNRIGPVDADRRLRSLTGGEGIGEIQKEFSDTMEVLVKFGSSSSAKK